MIKKMTLILALTALVAASNVPPAFASHRTEVCDDETHTSGSFRKVLVPEGSDCTLRGVTVQNDVLVLEGGSLSLLGSQVGDDLRGRDPESIRVDCNVENDPCTPSSIGDDVTVNGTTSIPAFPANYICNGTTIGGDVHIEESGSDAPWQIGGEFCNVVNSGGNVIQGDVELESNAAQMDVENNDIRDEVEVEDNTGAVEINDNDIAEDLEVEDNTGGVVITNNRIDDDLECDDNNPPPTQSATNTVGDDAKGQCSSGFTAPGP